MKRLLFAVMLCWAAGGAAETVQAPQSPEELFREASAFFQEGNQAAAQDASKAQALYRKALLRYEQIVNEGVHSGKLYYNIGNTYFLLGDLGRAILNYRRASALTPRDPNLAQSLAFAQSRTEDRIEPAEESKVLRLLLFWHYDFSAAGKAKAGIVLVSIFWLLLGLRHSRRLTLPRIVLGVALVLGAALLTSSMLDAQVQPGVITAQEATARKGDGLSYEPSFERPLHSGTEFVLKEQRGEWVLVELPNGSRCWLPRESVELC